MKTFPILILLLLLSVLALGQNQPAATAAESACGPANVKFDAKQDPTQHPMAQEDSSKAVIYVVQETGELKCSGCALTKIGVDGAWVAANQGSSYSFFSIEPGERHLCVNWQSRLSLRSRAFAFADVNAEAGKVYYLRNRIFLGHLDYYFDLDPVNSDQGKYLVATSAFSVSHPRK